MSVDTAQRAALALVLIIVVGCAPISTPSTRIATATPVATSTPRCHYRDNGTLPDPHCTPGAIDPRVTQGNLDKTICRSGYSASVRPSTSYTNRLKLEQMREYGAPGSPADYEEDHLVSLELGGNPTNPENLWPQPGGSPNPKDRIENELHRMVCDGTMTLDEAQKRIRTDWRHALE